MNKPNLNVSALKKKQQQYLQYQLEIYKSVLNQCYRQIEVENQKAHTSTVFTIPLSYKGLDYPYDNLCRYMINNLNEQKEISHQVINNWRQPDQKQLYISWGDAFVKAKEHKSRKKRRQPHIKTSSIPKDVYKMYK